MELRESLGSGRRICRSNAQVALRSAGLSACCAQPNLVQQERDLLSCLIGFARGCEQPKHSHTAIQAGGTCNRQQCGLLAEVLEANTTQEPTVPNTEPTEPTYEQGGVYFVMRRVKCSSRRVNLCALERKWQCIGLCSPSHVSAQLVIVCFHEPNCRDRLWWCGSVLA